MTEINLTILGKPIPLSRTGHGQFGGKYFSAPTSRQIGLVVDAWERAGGIRFPDDSPLHLTCTFCYERPKSHFGTGRNAGKLKDSAPSFPIGPADVDNLVKLLMESLQGNAFRNDSRIVRVSASKVYRDRAWTDLTILHA